MDPIGTPGEMITPSPLPEDFSQAQDPNGGLGADVAGGKQSQPQNPDPTPTGVMPDSGFDPDQFQKYATAQRSAQAQQLAWKALDALSRNWATLRAQPSLGADPNSMSQTNLVSAVGTSNLSKDDKELLSAFLQDAEAFSYVDRLGGAKNGQIEKTTVDRYGSGEEARRSMVSDAAALDTANKAFEPNLSDMADAMISWDDLQARISDPETPADLKAQLQQISRQTYDLLRGNSPFLKVDDLFPVASFTDPAQPASDTSLKAARDILLKDSKALDTAYQGLSTKKLGHKDSMVSWQDIQTRILDQNVPENTRAQLQKISRATFDALSGGKPLVDMNALLASTPPAPAPDPGLDASTAQTLLNYGIVLDATTDATPDGKFNLADMQKVMARTDLPPEFKSALESLGKSDNAGFNTLDKLDGWTGGDVRFTALAEWLSKNKSGSDADAYARAAAAFDTIRKDAPLIDTGAQGAKLDGYVLQRDLQAAVGSTALKDSDKQILKPAAEDKLFDVLDMVDGSRDKRIHAQPQGAESTDIRQVAMTDSFFNTTESVQSQSDLAQNTDQAIDNVIKKVLGLDQYAFSRKAVEGLLDDKNLTPGERSLLRDMLDKGSVDKSLDFAKKLDNLHPDRGSTDDGLISVTGDIDEYYDDANSTEKAMIDTFRNRPDDIGRHGDKDDPKVSTTALARLFMVSALEGQRGGSTPQGQFTQSDLANSAKTDASTKAAAEDPTAFNAMDRLDGSYDKKADLAALSLPGQEWAARLFQVDSNKGGEGSVLTQSLSAMAKTYSELDAGALPDQEDIDRGIALVDNYAAINASLGHTDRDPISYDDLKAALADSKSGINKDDRPALQKLIDDRGAFKSLAKWKDNADDKIHYDFARELVSLYHQVQLPNVLGAKAALDSGIPLPEREFDDTIDGGFVRNNLLDAGKVEKAFNEIMADPAVQSDFGSKVVELTDDPEGKARQLVEEVTSPYYASAMRHMESEGKSAEAQKKLASDLSALKLLETGLKNQGKPVLINGKSPSEEALDRMGRNITMAVFEEGNFTNIPQELGGQAITDVLEVVSGLRGGQIATRLSGNLATLAKESGLLKSELGHFDGKLGQLGKDLAKLFGIVQSNGKQASELQPLMDEVNSKQFSAAVSDPKWRNDIKNFLSTLDKHGLLGSAAGALGVAAGSYRLTHPTADGDAWDRLSSSLSFVAASSYGTSYAKTAAMAWNAVGLDATSFPEKLDVSLADLLKGEAGGGASRGIAAGIKGVAAASDLAGGVISMALGGHQLATGIKSGDASEIAAGGLNILSGGTWAAGGVLSIVGSALATPLFVVAGVLAFAALIISSIFGDSAQEQFVNKLKDKWQPMGMMKDGAEDQLNDWYVQNLHMETDNLAGA